VTQLQIFVTKAVDAEQVAPGIWIHRTHIADGKTTLWWTVSHSSGMAFGSFPKREHADIVAAHLAGLRDWGDMDLWECHSRLLEHYGTPDAATRQWANVVKGGE
jgi:hypothetical protein